MGILRYRNALRKLSRDPQVARWQLQIRDVPDQPVLPARTFLTHHQRPSNDAVLSECQRYRYTLTRLVGHDSEDG